MKSPSSRLESPVVEGEENGRGQTRGGWNLREVPAQEFGCKDPHTRHFWKRVRKGLKLRDLMNALVQKSEKSAQRTREDGKVEVEGTEMLLRL